MLGMTEILRFSLKVALIVCNWCLISRQTFHREKDMTSTLGNCSRHSHTFKVYVFVLYLKSKIAINTLFYHVN